jgi:hypothetical protein
MTKERLNPGEIVKNKWGDIRVIFNRNPDDDGYLVVDYNKAGMQIGYFWNPTNSFMSDTVYKEKWIRVGELPKEIVGNFLDDVRTIMDAHGKAFIMAHTLLNGNPKYRPGIIINADDLNDKKS